MRQPELKIIYIMGLARSGTTILEALLAHNKEIFGLGEVTHIFRDGLLSNEICSCGNPARTCPLWADVMHRCSWFDKDAMVLRNIFESASSHARFFYVLLFGLRKRDSRIFQKANQCIFDAVSRYTDTKVLVDSSKYAGRALLLEKAFPGCVRVVCLTRSPAALLDSLRKPLCEHAQKSLLGAAAYYFYTLLCLRITSWRLGTCVLHLRYEELSERPARHLLEIGRHCGVEVAASLSAVENREQLKFGHVVTGNRIRRNGHIIFQAHHATPDMSTGARITVYLMERWRRLLAF